MKKNRIKNWKWWAMLPVALLSAPVMIALTIVSLFVALLYTITSTVLVSALTLFVGLNTWVHGRHREVNIDLRAGAQLHIAETK